MFEKKIDALQAQIELATHNLQHFEKRAKDQQAVIAQLGEEQDNEEQACEDIQEQLDQMKKGSERKGGLLENLLAEQRLT